MNYIQSTVRLPEGHMAELRENSKKLDLPINYLFKEGALNYSRWLLVQREATFPRDSSQT